MRITQGAKAARDMLNTVAVSFGRDALTLAGLVIVMVMQDPIMSAICLLGGPFVAVALRKLSRRIREVAQSQNLSISTIVGGDARDLPGHPHRQGVPGRRAAARAHAPGHRGGRAHGQQDRAGAGAHERA